MSAEQEDEINSANVVFSGGGGGGGGGNKVAIGSADLRRLFES